MNFIHSCSHRFAPCRGRYGRTWHLPSGWLIVLLAILAIGCQAETTTVEPTNPTASDSDAAGATVTLQIDWREKKPGLEITVPCSNSTTVFEVLETARAGGQLEFESKGRGETAFVTSIGGVGNEGANGDNWVFYVNGSLADQGSGAFSVKAGDEIKWVLGKYP